MSSFKNNSSLERTLSIQKIENEAVIDEDDENLLVKKQLNSARPNINQINTLPDYRKKPI